MDDVTCIERLKEKDAEIAVMAELVEMLESIVKPGAYKDLAEIQALINKHKGE